MKKYSKSIVLAACVIACGAQAMSGNVIAGEINKKTFRFKVTEDQEHGHEAKKQASAPAPHERTELPPTANQLKFNLPMSKVERQEILSRSKKQINTLTNSSMAAPPVSTPACKDMNVLATYSGSALADYIVNLPSYECTYGLFSLTSAQGATIYSPSNVNAIVSRFSQEASNYNASNWALVSTALYLRAGYYLASGSTISPMNASVMTNLRSPISQLINGTKLYDETFAR